MRARHKRAGLKTRPTRSIDLVASAGLGPVLHRNAWHYVFAAPRSVQNGAGRRIAFSMCVKSGDAFDR